MDIKALGPLGVIEQGTSVVPTAGKPRQLLALFALRSDRVVPVPVLIEEVWGVDIPRSAGATLHTYIMKLRRNIAEAMGERQPNAAKDILVTQYGGYVLHPGHGRNDIEEFRSLAARGGLSLEMGDARTASFLLRQALELWRGAALENVPRGPVLDLEITALEEDRLSVLRQRIDADLMLERHTLLIAELGVLVRRYPLDESFCAQYMLALYRSGSPWRALEAYQVLHRTLSDELGVQPSARLRELQQTMLVGDADPVHLSALGAGRQQQLVS
jgi:DNA-binding SARP family transcriptional activator